MTPDWPSIEEFVLGLFVVLSAVLAVIRLLLVDVTLLLHIFEDWARKRQLKKKGFRIVRRRRRLSAETRKKISLAQKKRWAKRKKA